MEREAARQFFAANRPGGTRQSQSPPMEEADGQNRDLEASPQQTRMNKSTGHFNSQELPNSEQAKIDAARERHRRYLEQVEREAFERYDNLQDKITKATEKRHEWLVNHFESNNHHSEQIRATKEKKHEMEAQNEYNILNKITMKRQQIEKNQKKRERELREKAEHDKVQLQAKLQKHNENYHQKVKAEEKQRNEWKKKFNGKLDKLK